MILDTSAISDSLREEPRLRRQFTVFGRICIPVVVLGEYRFGLLFSKHRQTIEAKLEELTGDVEVLAIEEQTTTFYGDIRSELKAAGTPMPSSDLWIAALVRQHDLPLLSRDSHFDSVRGITRVDW
jgi:tRNA(fMet)-specific endonuclease VapC